jgi:hypothetical protein
MYYIDMLNNGQYPKDRKLSVPSNPWSLYIVGITRASTLGSLDIT